jgi:hypothetical protein
MPLGSEAACPVRPRISFPPIEYDRVTQTQNVLLRACRSSASIGYCGLDDCFPQLALVREKPVVVEPQPLLERGRGFPAKCLDAAAVEQLAWRSVRSRAIKHDATFEAHAALDVLGELCDRDVVTRADIDMRNVPVAVEIGRQASIASGH